MGHFERLTAVMVALMLVRGPPVGADNTGGAGDPCWTAGAVVSEAGSTRPYPSSRPAPEPVAQAMDELWTWVRQRTGLPDAALPPSVRVVEAQCLEELRGLGPAGGALAIEALYAPEAVTILLQRRWHADSIVSRSVLVHELVHHAQALGARTFACTAAAEKEAYAIQEAWLGQYGLDLEGTFGLDNLTRLVLTECAM